MRMMRCIAGLSVTIVGTDVTEHFWPGLEVNFDRELKPATEHKPAYTLAEAVAGRENCFEEAGAGDESPAPIIDSVDPADSDVRLPTGHLTRLPPEPKE